MKSGLDGGRFAVELRLRDGSTRKALRLKPNNLKLKRSGRDETARAKVRWGQGMRGEKKGLATGGAPKKSGASVDV